MNTLITFGEFASLAKRRGLTLQFLAEHFKGSIEAPLGFFNRVMQPRFHQALVPYKSVMEFYLHEITHRQEEGRKFCACGCGVEVWDRKKWARPGCKKRIQRMKS